MTWTTGNWSSTPEDGRCFIEKDNAGRWWVYQTDEEGGLIEGFPLACSYGFDTLEEAQGWALENVPARLGGGSR